VKLLTLIALILIAGCAPRQQQDINGHLSQLDAIRLARSIAHDIGGNHFRVSDASRSMGDFLSPNEIAITIHAWDSIEVGQVVVFRRGKDNIIHQVVAERGGLFRTSGIANKRSDSEWLTPENYLGTYIGRVLYAQQEKRNQ